MIRDLAGIVATVALATGLGPQARAQAISQVTSQVTNQVISPSGGTTHVHIYNYGAPGGGPANPGPFVEAPPPAAGRSYWDHNRSVMYLVANGARRRFYYHRPRPGMAEAGARSGSLLFDGVRAGHIYSGTAYVFAGACGRFDYKVDGYVVAESRVVMRGLAPRVDPRSVRLPARRAGLRPAVRAVPGTGGRDDLVGRVSSGASASARAPPRGPGSTMEEYDSLRRVVQAAAPAVSTRWRRA